MLDRMNQLIKAYINEGLERIEDPAIMVKQYMRDVKEQVLRAEKEWNRAKLEKKTLEHNLSAARDLFAKREEQAVIAIQAGDEELARKILLNKKEIWERMNELEKRIAENDEVRCQKELEFEQLQTKYTQLQEKNLELIVRVQAVRASKQMNGRNEKVDGQTDWIDKQVMNPEWEKESEIERELAHLRERVQSNS
ncbi:PspA/IM30 family protein [Alkalihalobacillus sp. MEB130]|uniref:PspA/IM30 family protein n=1 Tax=Alkalihalobacillus sp. MEB130 TaxID=2976704 RepID=UPI0028DF0F5D|nr:PspA/IM30 family protein [Alkalihalobacillus sp. MEB130]MDT8862011.1 PspA/IM30 family protein [Alkalihalobacillus sp. MEB130]